MRNDELKKGEKGGYDPHKMCMVQADRKRLADDHAETKRRLQETNRVNFYHFFVEKKKFINKLLKCCRNRRTDMTRWKLN